MLKKQIIPIVRAFQSALPRGERLHGKPCTVSLKEFQSALPRGERLPYTELDTKAMKISIRAPTRGATL